MLVSVNFLGIEISLDDQGEFFVGRDGSINWSSPQVANSLEIQFRSVSQRPSVSECFEQFKTALWGECCKVLLTGQNEVNKNLHQPNPVQTRIELLEYIPKSDSNWEAWEWGDDSGVRIGWGQMYRPLWTGFETSYMEDGEYLLVLDTYHLGDTEIAFLPIGFELETTRHQKVKKVQVRGGYCTCNLLQVRTGFITAIGGGIDQHSSLTIPPGCAFVPGAEQWNSVDFLPYSDGKLHESMLS
jgi:hypothetical protein